MAGRVMANLRGVTVTEVLDGLQRFALIDSPSRFMSQQEELHLSGPKVC